MCATERRYRTTEGGGGGLTPQYPERCSFLHPPPPPQPGTHAPPTNTAFRSPRGFSLRQLGSGTAADCISVFAPSLFFLLSFSEYRHQPLIPLPWSHIVFFKVSPLLSFPTVLLWGFASTFFPISMRVVSVFFLFLCGFSLLSFLISMRVFLLSFPILWGVYLLFSSISMRGYLLSFPISMRVYLLFSSISMRGLSAFFSYFYEGFIWFLFIFLWGFIYFLLLFLRGFSLLSLSITIRFCLLFLFYFCMYLPLLSILFLQVFFIYIFLLESYLLCASWADFCFLLLCVPNSIRASLVCASFYPCLTCMCQIF